MSSPENPDAAAELKKLADLLDDPDHRQSFASDPDGTLEQVDVDPDAIPDEVLSTLKGLSHEELQVLTRLNSSLKSSGISVDAGGQGNLGVF